MKQVWEDILSASFDFFGSQTILAVVAFLFSIVSIGFAFVAYRRVPKS